MSETLLPHLQDATFLYSAGGENGGDLQHIGVEHEASQLVVAKLETKSRKLDELPHNEMGLDVRRIDGFFERYGLDPKRFVGVDETGQQDINEIMGYGRGDTDTVASHFPLLDFTYVLRGAYEAGRGTDASEAETVHELSHAENPFWDILIKKDDGFEGGVSYGLLRNGFALHRGLKSRGSYFEEGFAEIMQHKYITEELDLPNGFIDRVEPKKIEKRVSDSRSASYLLPGYYLYASAVSNEPAWHTSAHAAYGMQLLIAQDPEIFPAMLESRKGAAGLSEFARRVDLLSPGLYSTLNRQRYDQSQFVEATRLIIDTLYDGNQEEALAVAIDQDSDELAIAA